MISARELTDQVQTHLATKSKVSPFSTGTLRETREAIAGAAGLHTANIHDCPPGQPFYTALLEGLLTAAEDIDASFPAKLAKACRSG